MINRFDCRQEAKNKITKRRENAENTALENREKILRKHPELWEVERKIEANYKKTITALISGATEKEIEKIRDDHKKIVEDRDNLLDLLKIKKDEYFPKYFCEKCEDTGAIGEKDCDCLTALIRQLAYQQMCKEFPANKYHFEDFSLDFYPDKKVKERMEDIYNKTLEYAENFGKNSSSLFFQGGTGLGKTHISLSIANKVAKKGFGVLYNSTQNFLTAVEKEHFGNDKEGDALISLLECDLLILDDLGTEFLTQFTTSVLYNIINTRYINSRPTIISSNLTPRELEERYGQQLFSRFAGCFEWLVFLGGDIRKQKKFSSK